MNEQQSRRQIAAGALESLNMPKQIRSAAKTDNRGRQGPDLQKYLQEVKDRLASLAVSKPGNHYNSPTPTLGLSVPQSRAALKAGYSFLRYAPDRVLEIFDHIWKNGKYFEEMSQPIYHYEKKSLSVDEFNTISGWIEKCDNWAHSDGLSSIYARVLEEMPELVLPVLQNWNRSDNPWKRRQSVVSLLYYARLRKKILPYELLIGMVTNLLADDEYYVQKGVGWTIREIYNCYPEATLRFIEAQLDQISAAAWQATSEKLPAPLRKKLVAQRRR